MIDLEREKENFKGHKATLVDYGKIKMLDFKNPNSGHYRIRFLFEEDYCRLHISGDLGELTATNYKNMTYEYFLKDFANDVSYFEGKIDCHNRRLYVYDEKKAREQLLEIIKEDEYEEELIDKFYCETVDEALDEIFCDFNTDRGLSSEAYSKLSDVICDFWEIAGDLGKERTGILELYLLAFKLAVEDLKFEEMEGETNVNDNKG